MMFLEGRGFEETPEYLLFREQLQAGEKPYGIESMADLPDRGKQLLDTYISLEKNGWLPSENRGQPPWDEVHLYVTASGALAQGRHGNHRLAMARTLGLDRMPAVLGGVHPDWLRTLPYAIHNLRSAVYQDLQSRFGASFISLAM